MKAYRYLNRSLAVAALFVAGTVAFAGCAHCKSGAKTAGGAGACTTSACALPAASTGQGAVKATAAECALTRECFLHDGVPLIPAEAVQALKASGAAFVLVDARTGKWYDGTRIQGAIAYKDDFTAKHPDKNAVIVTYCGSYHCPASTALAKDLIAKGYTHVLDYKGGIKEWQELGLPTEKD